MSQNCIICSFFLCFECCISGNDGCFMSLHMVLVMKLFNKVKDSMTCEVNANIINTESPNKLQCLNSAINEFNLNEFTRFKKIVYINNCPEENSIPLVESICSRDDLQQIGGRIDLISINIGNRINKYELDCLTTRDKIFNFKQFEDLNVNMTQFHTIQSEICEPPTALPTTSPSPGPTREPTPDPTDSLTESPTAGPTDYPTKGPTKEPTKGPTKEPTPAPTDNPTQSPTDGPTNCPSRAPTSEPTPSASLSPSFSPTLSPTHSPGYSAHPTPNQINFNRTRYHLRILNLHLLSF